MPEAIRFFLDENIPSAVGVGLITRGIDAVTVTEVGRRGFADSEQLQFATENNRVLVTFDRDYLVINSTGQEHAGIAWCYATKYSIGDLIRCLAHIHASLTAEEMRNQVNFL